jgi:hypothetical protein
MKAFWQSISMPTFRCYSAEGLLERFFPRCDRDGRTSDQGLVATYNEASTWQHAGKKVKDADMAWAWLIVAVVVVGGVILVLAWRRLRSFGWAVQLERARELFVLQRERLEARFISAAAASGKPRGLRWQGCDFENEVAFARERRTGQLAALVGVTIQFEAVEGSDMEGLPAVGNLRNASAVFFFQRGQWLTVGKAIFNMNPPEAIEHFKTQYERVGHTAK